MKPLIDRLFRELEAGQMDAAGKTAQLIAEQIPKNNFNPSEILPLLDRARTLARVQRSHIHTRLRALNASRLYTPPVPSHTTWAIEG